MTWDDLLARLARAGHAPEELDFMDNYGAIASTKYPQLAGRHLRCLFGTIRIDETIRADAYVFPSPGDAQDFRLLMDPEPGWHREANIVFRCDPADIDALRKALDDAVDLSGS